MKLHAQGALCKNADRPVRKMRNLAAVELFTTIIDGGEREKVNRKFNRLPESIGRKKRWNITKVSYCMG